MIRVLLTLFSLFPMLAWGHEISSPWTTPARTYLLAGTALTVGLVATKHSIDEPFQRETVREKPLGDWHTVGDYGGQFIPNALYMGGMATAYWLSENAKYWKWAGVMTRASLYAVATSTALKVVVRERRPNGSDLKSFPSGHTTAAFAFASVVVAEHGIWPYGAGALALASLTAYSRINDNEHYLHDVVAGATIGTAFGLGVSYYNRAETTDTKGPTASLTPYYTHDEFGLLYTTLIP